MNKNEVKEDIKEVNIDNIGDNDKRPEFIPVKFWNKQKGEILVENLAKSYAEMERRFSSQSNLKDRNGDDEILKTHINSINMPKTADEYEIDIASEFLNNDPHINKLLHDANFNQDQAQLVYDLAAVEIMPMIQRISDKLESETANAKLESHFGGNEKWHEISQQIRKWGENNLPNDAYDALSASVDGIKAMHKMMGQGDEPSLLGGGNIDEIPTEDSLRQLMNDKRYWRERDPKIIQQVSEGFKRLYPS